MGVKKLLGVLGVIRLNEKVKRPQAARDRGEHRLSAFIRPRFIHPRKNVGTRRNVPMELAERRRGSARNRAEFSVKRADRLLGGLGAKLVAVEGGAALLRYELSLDMTEPAHSQCGNAIHDLADVFGSVFFQLLWGFHFEPMARA